MISAPKGDALSHLTSWQLGSDDHAPSTARHLVDGLVTAGNPTLGQDPRDTLLLLVSEVVTNAIHHGSPPITLTVNVDPEALHVEVVDHGSDIPQQREQPSPLSEHGRGLVLLEALAAAWGTSALVGGGKKVWFDVPTVPA